ncbi:YrdC domain-containing protein, mitochondrial [Nymphon striatum]|nr:YrdC domain-containing protein, mitochondrial [Nymphon striatum]
MEIESFRRERDEARANILALEQLMQAKSLSLSSVEGNDENSATHQVQDQERMDNSNNIINIDMNGCVDNHSIDVTVNALQKGGIVAVPTDTLYGLTANVSCPQSIKKIFEIKKRNISNSLAICVSEIEDIKIWANVPDPLIPLLEELLPGPVTVLLTRSSNLPITFNVGNPLVGVRIPQNSFLRQVVKSLGTPIALTSANVSGSESTLSTQEFKPLWHKLDLVVDGGVIGESATHSRSGSTIIDLSNIPKYTIVRRGMDYERILKILKEKYHLEEKLI